MRRVVHYPQSSGFLPTRKLIAVLAIVCIGIAGCFYAVETYSHWRAERELKELIDYRDRLQAERISLEGNILLLQDLDYLELRARRDLGLVRPGETIFSIGD